MVGKTSSVDRREIAFDRLLETLAEELVERYLEEVERGENREDTPS